MTDSHTDQLKESQAVVLTCRPTPAAAAHGRSSTSH